MPTVKTAATRLIEYNTVLRTLRPMWNTFVCSARKHRRQKQPKRTRRNQTERRIGVRFNVKVKFVK